MQEVAIEAQIHLSSVGSISPSQAPKVVVRFNNAHVAKLLEEWLTDSSLVTSFSGKSSRVLSQAAIQAGKYVKDAKANIGQCHSVQQGKRCHETVLLNHLGEAIESTELTPMDWPGLLLLSVHSDPCELHDDWGHMQGVSYGISAQGDLACT